MLDTPPPPRVPGVSQLVRSPDRRTTAQIRSHHHPTHLHVTHWVARGKKEKTSTQQRILAKRAIKSNDMLVQALQDIIHTQVELDKQKLELHKKQLEEKMLYSPEKDKVNQENTRLSLLNQNMVV
jgi:hypothetical protein